MTQSTNLMTDIDKRIQFTEGFPPVRYISADEMAFLRARAITLRSQASRDVFRGLAKRIAAAFHSRPAEWAGPAVTAK